MFSQVFLKDILFIVIKKKIEENIGVSVYIKYFNTNGIEWEYFMSLNTREAFARVRYIQLS